MKRPSLVHVVACSLLLAGCGEGSLGSGPMDDGQSSESSVGTGGGSVGSGGGTSAGGGDGSGGSGAIAGSSSIGSGGLEVEGTIFVSKDYEAEDASDVGADSVGEMVYVPGGGFSGSNCWELHLFGDVYDEDHVGWTPGALIPEGATQRMYVGHLLYVSQRFVELVSSTDLGGKMLDAYMWPRGSQSRQVVAFEEQAAYGDRVANYLVKGGAGHKWGEQSAATAFDFRDYVDQWIWFEYVFDAEERYTALWIKTQDGVFTGAQDAPLMRREADDPADWTGREWDEAPYEYTSLGWSGPGHLWGYWGQLLGVPFDDTAFIRLDNLIISDGWIAPPEL